MLSRGADVVDIGLASTDELWFASGRLGLPGAMFTASHNPGEYNGIKFCLAEARPISPAQLVEIADRAMGDEPVAAAARGQYEEQDLLPAYADHLHSLVDLTGIRRLTVVADAGNGMAGHTLPAVLGPVDLELIGLFTDPDGTFPNHAPNPLEPKNLVDAQAAVIEHGADLALVFDGDADRCFIIDERGEVVSPSAVTAMIASQELLREPGATIVCNKITSWAVRGGGRRGRRRDRDHPGRSHLRQGGDGRAECDLRRRALRALLLPRLLGCGHRDARRRCTCSRWPAAADRPLSELSARFNRYAASGEINTLVEDQQLIMDRVAAAFADRGDQDRIDGLTVAGPDWWVNVRPSNTEPLLRLNVEAASESQMAALRDEALGLIRA